MRDVHDVGTPPTHNREPYDTRTVLSNIMFL